MKPANQKTGDRYSRKSIEGGLAEIAEELDHLFPLTPEGIAKIEASHGPARVSPPDSEAFRQKLLEKVRNQGTAAPIKENETSSPLQTEQSEVPDDAMVMARKRKKKKKPGQDKGGGPDNGSPKA